MFFSTDGEVQHFILNDKEGVSSGKYPALCGQQLPQGLIHEAPIFRNLCAECFIEIKDNHHIFVVAHQRGGLFRNGDLWNRGRPDNALVADRMAGQKVGLMKRIK